VFERRGFADKLSTEVSIKTEMLWKSSQYVDTRVDSVLRLLLLFTLAMCHGGGEYASLPMHP